MNKIKKGLGRGLSSLIGETKVENKTNNLSLAKLKLLVLFSTLVSPIKEDNPLPSPFLILFIMLHSQFYFPVP